MSTETSPDMHSARWLAAMLAEITGLDEQRFLDQTGFDELGLDSISVNQFNAKLALHVSGVPRTLLFDCRTLDDLNSYLLKHHSADLLRVFDAGQDRSELAASHASAWPALASRLPSDEDGAPAPHAPSGSSMDSGRRGDAIAIVGLAGRYPDADDVAAFWRNLASARNSVREVPVDRWALAGFYEAAENAGQNGRSYCKWGAFLENVERFDAEFFGVAPREADTMDPQERIFLEIAWQALEDAGIYQYRSIRGHTAATGFPVSVHVGVTTQTYHLHGPALWQRGIPVFPTSLQWSIANRVSYLLNLRGPSMPVDTACSASLTALHLACTGLRSGEAEMALVGGVNLYLHPSKFVWLSQQRMLTATGQCHTFSDDADGFVPGEGVGAVVLKPLSAALRDGNHIYGLVAASSVNHGGRTNGYTVPSPSAQAALVGDAMTVAGVDAGAVSYVEAHGTGTRLGDPVEIDGLTMAFKNNAGTGELEAEQRCAIASTKTNIGHLESAAGIAGLTRILLQMKHGQIAPSLNLRALNPNIDLSRSPFRIVTSLETWMPPPPASGKLIAGVSSFGAGGANAHALIASHEQRRPTRNSRLSGPTVFPLSAKSRDALSARAIDLLGHLGDGTISDDDMSALAYTLQLAREPLPLRAAVVAATRQELVDRLEAFVKEQTLDGLCVGEASRGAAGSPATTSTDPNEQARAWVIGQPVDWRKSWPDSSPTILSLPPYRFGGDQYWAGRTKPSANAGRPLPWAGFAEPGHMRAHDSASVLGSSSSPGHYHVALDGNEAFLIQHKIGGRALLSGTTMLELVRASAARLLGGCAALRDVTFGRPCIPGTGLEIEIVLRPRGPGNDAELAFEVRSGSGERSPSELHARGTACRDPGHRRPVVHPTADLPKQVVPGEQIYAEFRRCGLDYGPIFQPLASVRVMTERIEATIALPAGAEQLHDRFQWHPGILDACFQSIVPLLPQSDESPQVPFSLGRLEVFGALDDVRSLVVTPSISNAAQAPRHFDVAMLDQAGATLASAADIVLRPSGGARQHGTEIAWLTPNWRPSSDLAETLPPRTIPLALGSDEFTRAMGFEISRLTGSPLRSIASIADSDPQGIAVRHFLILSAQTADDIGPQLDELYTLCRALIPTTSLGPIRLVLGYAREPNSQTDQQTLGAFARTLKQECPAITMDVIGLPSIKDLNIPAAARALLTELAAARAQPLILRHSANGRREHQTFEKVAPPATRQIPALHSEASYLITGGAGGLGLLFARHLARRAPGCSLILCGRRPIDSQIRTSIQQLAELGARPRYEAADITRREAVGRLAAALLSTPGEPPLRGVIHAAGVLRDGFILRKSPGEAAEVLAPKLLALRQLDAALADANLQWMVLFSSLAAVLGNIGQSDYAVANAALDQFAEWRNRQRSKGRRTGVTVSVNWPLWDSGGMRVDAMTRQRHVNNGIAAIDEADGLAIFDAALVAALSGDMPDQLFPLRATESALRNIRAQFEEAPERTTGPSFPPDTSAGARSQLVLWLRELVSQTLGQPLSRVTAGASFRDLGIDSVMVMEMNEAIEQRFNSVSKTLFFEFDTIEEVAEQLAAQQPIDQGVARDEPTAHVAPAADDSLEDTLFVHLARLLSEVTGRPLTRIDANTSFAAIGLDSIMVMDLNAKLEADIDNLSRTLFFECATLGEVVQRILLERPEQVAKRFAAAARSSEAPPSHDRVSPMASAPANANTPAVVPSPRDVAIIGLAGRYPGADNLSAFWTNLCNGRDCVTEVPPDRWAVDGKSPNRRKEGRYARWGSFLDNVDKFDPLFFGISPREAERTDPQERLFLETAWHAIEEAGYTPESLQKVTADAAERRSVGVFVGVMYGEYQYLGVEAMARGENGLSQSSYASIANRVSYTLDFCGPSMAIDTMCSSSLSAVHQACEALFSGSCDIALAGGVNLSLHPYKYRTLEELKFASTDGRCRSFGDGGDGYVPGEGVGAVVLKPLARALADGDHIHAIIRGSAVNHGGRTNGYTVPNPTLQGRLVADAFRRADVPAYRVSYVEAHGTGTPLGDPIEVRGLAMAFGPRTASEQRCAIGSIKSNLGHLEAASGIAALTKVLMQMRHRKLVPTLHCSPLNPNIRFEETPFCVQTTYSDWPAQQDESGTELPRLAGISSFGAGGSNAHIVVEEFPQPQRATTRNETPQIFVLSARSEDLLKKQAKQLIDWLEKEHDATRHSPRDIALTLQLGRVAHPFRLAVVTRDPRELLDGLRIWLLGKTGYPHTLLGRAPEDAPPAELIETDSLFEASAIADAARAWTSGKAMWKSPGTRFFRVSLPGTVWSRRRCWLEETIVIQRGDPVPLQPQPPAPTPRQVLALYQQGRIDHSEAVLALQHLNRQAGAA